MGLNHKGSNTLHAEAASNEFKPRLPLKWSWESRGDVKPNSDLGCRTTPRIKLSSIQILSNETGPSQSLLQR